MKVDNNNTGALDNRAQQMDSGGFTLLVSGYYGGHGHLDNHQYIRGHSAKMATMSICHHVTISQSHNANVTICYVTLPFDVLTRLYFWFIETTTF